MTVKVKSLTQSLTCQLHTVCEPSSLHQVFEELQGIHNMVRMTSSSPSSFLYPPPPSTSHAQSQPVPRPPSSLDSSVGALSTQMSKLGPLEDTSCALTPPDPLLSSSSSFGGPCETDESRGFSQYHRHSQLRSNETSSRSLSLSIRDGYHCASGPAESQFSQPSVPTEDQYNFSQPNYSGRSGPPHQRTAESIADATAGAYSVSQCISPAGSLQSMSLRPSGRSKDPQTSNEVGLCRPEQGLGLDHSGVRSALSVMIKIQDM